MIIIARWLLANNLVTCIFSHWFLDALASCHSVIGVFDEASDTSDTSNTSNTSNANNVVTCFFSHFDFFLRNTGLIYSHGATLSITQPSQCDRIFTWHINIVLKIRESNWLKYDLIGDPTKDLWQRSKFLLILPTKGGSGLGVLDSGYPPPPKKKKKKKKMTKTQKLIFTKENGDNLALWHLTCNNCRNEVNWLFSDKLIRRKIFPIKCCCPHF